MTRGGGVVGGVRGMPSKRLAGRGTGGGTTGALGETVASGGC